MVVATEQVQLQIQLLVAVVGMDAAAEAAVGQQ